MILDNPPPTHHHEAPVQQIAHAIEHRYQHGENLHSVLNDEIHKLRTADMKHGHAAGKDFKHDLKKLEEKLHADHILPQVHIHTSGKHAGSIAFIGEHAPKHGTEHNTANKPDLKGHAHGDAQNTGTPEGTPRTRPGAGRSGAEREKPDSVEGAAGANDAGADGQGLPQLKAAIARAKAGGRPLNMVQIGDSHIAGGIETPALAKGLSDRLGVKVDYAKEGINGEHSAQAVQNPGFFLKDMGKNTDLVVVSFGSNDADTRAGQAYKETYEHLIQQIKTKAPNASIVMVGPTDGAYWGHPDRQLVGLDSVTAEQKQVAASVQNGSYFDIRARMGTINSMRSRGWLDESNLHFTPTGYQVIGDEIAEHIQKQLK